MKCLWLALGLLLPALSVHADQIAPISDRNTALLRSGVDDTRQHLDEFVNNATLSTAYSGCGLCQETGQCDHAFHGQPGQFCIQLTSGAPCCCPIYAQCAATPYECRCRRVAPHHYRDDDYHSRSSSGGWTGTIIFILSLLLCCPCCCYLMSRCARQESDENVAYAQPVGASQYGTYSNQYPSAPSYGGGGGGGNTMAAGALGALGGLGVGAALGSAYGGHNYSSGDVGVSSNDYSFSGDTGGGGDYSGYGGGTDTFAGDS